MSDSAVKMRKQLGLLEGVAIILGIILGSGIFISPKEVIENTGSVWSAISVWAICGVLATLGAMSYAELGTTLTQSGGDYHYINEAFGPLLAFLYLWDANFVFVPSTNAIMAVTFANNILSFRGCPIDPISQKLVAAVTICNLVAISILGGLSVHIMTSSRMCFAGARNGHMPELLAHINVNKMSPMPSLVFLMLISLVMLIPTDMTTLIMYCTVVESFFTVVSCSAVLWLRYKKPHLARPIKVPLWMPSVFVFVGVVLMIAPIVREPFAVVGGALMTLSGVPVYYIFVVNQPKFVAELSTKFTHTCQKLFLSAVEDQNQF
ncbi:unnamed protein product [Leptidea sinapis]|uniref:Amino acid permease/ SLC12A domain-containing protein n=1 Tax=Leptidea sinapis TaxID=189913 RepID=A0A5E4PRT3_9NEOP|nr:unnamed protein product [Leptidea sinapis]